LEPAVIHQYPTQHLNHSELIRLMTAFFVDLSFGWMETK